VSFAITIEETASSVGSQKNPAPRILARSPVILLGRELMYKSFANIDGNVHVWGLPGSLPSQCCFQASTAVATRLCFSIVHKRQQQSSPDKNGKQRPGNALEGLAENRLPSVVCASNYAHPINHLVRSGFFWSSGFL
jgi:hypothetical protein